MGEKTYTTPPEGLPSQQHPQYQVTRQTLHFPGLVQMPAAGPEGTPAIFVRIHAPYEQEIVTWVATCDGGPPQPPNPYGPECSFGLNDNRILLSMQFSALVPTPIGGGTAGHAWSMGGVYTYGKVQPEFGKGQMNSVPLGKIFYETQPVDANFVPAVAFGQGVLDPNFPTPIFAMPALPFMQFGGQELPKGP
jgi:hypothetical protein